jgi:hypothetical protein
MSIPSIVAAQIHDYPRVHRSRVNLAVHLVAIPLFWAGVVTLGLSLNGGLLLAALGAGAIAASIALQGMGHALEMEKAQPFTGPVNFLIRLTTESLIVFPRYVLSGGLARAWK